MRHNKDKQEAAIYMFTIVTIIFLPISTVASVLGMNTRDIRNMDKPQWVFWAAAIPLTTLVIVVSLFASGSFQWRKDASEKIVIRDPTRTVEIGEMSPRRTSTRRMSPRGTRRTSAPVGYDYR